MAKITINKIEFEFNCLEADSAEIFEREQKKIQSTAESLAKEKKPSVIIRKMCTTVETGIDAILGNGASAKIFDGKIDMANAVKVWGELTSQIVDNIKTDTEDALEVLQNV